MSQGQTRLPRVTVVGAGVVGLSTALRVLQEIPGVRVTVVADKFLQETTSHGPAGMFRPSRSLTKVTSKETYRKWCVDSFGWYHELNSNHDPADTGIIRVSGYQFSDVTEYPIHHDICYNFRELSSQELSTLPGNYRIKQLGGKFQRKKIHSLTELEGECDVMVNCAGLENRTLTDDAEMYPVRGHLMRVRAPWVRHFYVFNNAESYIYPGQDDVVLGGTRQKDEWDKSMTSSASFDDILDKCSKLQPGLKNSPVTSTWIGLRPHRKSTVRVESEILQLDGKKLQVVHNYGHGANGVALSWGTAVDACAQVKTILTNSNRYASKL